MNLLRGRMPSGSARRRFAASKLWIFLLATALVLSAGALFTDSQDAAVYASESGAKASDGVVGLPKRMRLLTTQQYINTIQYFFGPDIKVDIKFSPLPRTDGLLVAGSSVAGISGAQAEAYQKVASIVSAQVLAPERRVTLVPCKPKSEKAPDNACAAKFIGDVTTYLYRAPLPKERLGEMVAEAGKGAAQLNDFYAGLQLTLEGVLMSPEALFVAETDESDPKRPGQMRLDAISLASRLSLFLWNAAPDVALLRAAERGQLDSEKNRAKVVDMMLASPRLEAGVRAFFDDMFDFEAIEALAKDAAAYPYFLGEAAGDAREQTLRTIVDHLLTKDRDYRDLYTTRETFVSPALSIIYDVASTSTWRAIEFPPEAQRAGILTHVSFLALHSHPGRSSATLRGKALRELLLCQKVPPPPANVDFSAVENPRGNLRTARERVGVHLKNPVCAGCHRITDPIGLALENFDGAGQHRVSERGMMIDATGSLDGKQFTNVEGLTRALRDHPALPKCLLRRAFGYATAGKLPVEAAPALVDLAETMASEGYRLRPLFRAIALSPSFSAVTEAAAKKVEREKAAGLPLSQFSAEIDLSKEGKQ